MKNYLLAFACIALVGCQSGSDDDSDDAPSTPNMPSVGESRPANNDVPPEHQGTDSGSARVYAPESTTSSVLFTVNGAKSPLAIVANDKAVVIAGGGITEHRHHAAKNTDVVWTLSQAPAGQSCSPSSGVATAGEGSGVSISCEYDRKPPVPHIISASSMDRNGMSVTWSPSANPDGSTSNLSYRLHYSTDKAVAQAGNGSFQDFSDVTSGRLTTGVADTQFYIAIQAQNKDGEWSNISPVAALKTASADPVRASTVTFSIPETSITKGESLWEIHDSAFSQAPNIGDVIITSPGDSEWVKLVRVNKAGSTYMLSVEGADIADVFDFIELSSYSSNALSAQSQTTSGDPSTSRSSAASADSQLACVGKSEDGLQTSSVTYFATSRPGVTLNRFYDGSQDITTATVFMRGLLGGKSKHAFDAPSSINHKCELAIGDRTFTVNPESPSLPKVPVSVSGVVAIDHNVRSDGSIRATQTIAKTVDLDITYLFPRSDAEASTSINRSTVIDASSRSLESIAGAVSEDLTITPTFKFSIGNQYRASLSLPLEATTHISATPVDEASPIAKLRSLPFILDTYTTHSQLRMVAGVGIMDTVSPNAHENLGRSTVVDAEPEHTYKLNRLCAKIADENCSQIVDVSDEGDARMHAVLHQGNANTTTSAVQWEVWPANGYLEVDETNPSAATLRRNDNGAYTAIASITDSLGEAGRQYLLFNARAPGCNYGLGQPATEDMRRHFWRNKAEGYYFHGEHEHAHQPTREDYIEVCTHQNTEGDPDWGALTATYYAGQLHGLARRTDRSGRPIEYRFEHGRLKQTKTINHLAVAMADSTTDPNAQNHIDMYVTTYYVTRENPTYMSTERREVPFEHDTVNEAAWESHRVTTVHGDKYWGSHDYNAKQVVSSNWAYGGGSSYLRSHIGNSFIEQAESGDYGIFGRRLRPYCQDKPEECAKNTIEEIRYYPNQKMRYHFERVDGEMTRTYCGWHEPMSPSEERRYTHSHPPSEYRHTNGHYYCVRTQ